MSELLRAAAALRLELLRSFWPPDAQPDPPAPSQGQDPAPGVHPATPTVPDAAEEPTGP